MILNNDIIMIDLLLNISNKPSGVLNLSNQDK